MPADIDQQARDSAKDAAHKAEIAERAITQHMTDCVAAHAEDSKKFDKLEGSIGRVHARIDKLLWTVLVGVVGILANLVLPLLMKGG